MLCTVQLAERREQAHSKQQKRCSVVLCLACTYMRYSAVYLHSATTCVSCSGLVHDMHMPAQCSYQLYAALVLMLVLLLKCTGEMPRHILVTVDRSLVDKASPGTRVSVMGVASLFASGSARKQVNSSFD
jgi:MCM OB domain